MAEFLADDIWTGKYFTGHWVDGPGKQPVVEPATGDTLGHIGLGDPSTIASSAANAAAAQRDWAAASYEERAAVLRKAARFAEGNAEELTGWIVRESGSIPAKAGFEVSITIKALHEASALPSQSMGEVLPSAPGRLSIARRRPLGVVGVIPPFNFPLYLAMRAVAPALALGNAVVVKPDPRTAVCGGFSIARIFEEAGLPAGVLHVLPGDGACGAALTADPNIAMIQFTGSTAAGRKVGEAAGRHLKKVSLELGGKNSLIILDDADVDLAVANAVWSSFLHQGQICMSSGRLLVQRGIHDKFAKALAAKASGMVVGDPNAGQVHLGPLINQHQLDHAQTLLKQATDSGAELLAGGKTRDLFFEPAVLQGVTKDNPIYHEEAFAPIAALIAFDTDDDAVDLANDTEYGLSMGIISSNVGRAMALGERLKTGLLHINDATVNDDVVNPFGGVGASGNGTSIGGPANLEEFTQWQWMTVRGEAIPYPL